jgi:hypothetical protein
VDLGDVPPWAERSTSDDGTRDPVAHDRDLEVMELTRRVERLDVRPQVVVELALGQIDEGANGFEALVMIDDEDRKRRADVGAEQHAPAWGVRGIPVRFQIGRPVAVHGAVGVDPGVALGMALLTEQQHVVPRRSPHLDDPGGDDVGPRALQQPSVPHEDPHRSHRRARGAQGSRGDREADREGHREGDGDG